jgi:RND family efflux transporter MFP subunit
MIMFPTRFFIAAVIASGWMTASGGAAPIELAGITEPFHDVILGLANPGIIRQEFYHEGDFAKKGDVILELDTRLEELEVSRRKAVMTQDKTVLDSTREVYETTKSISKQDLSKAQAEYEVAQAECGIAEQQLADRRLVAPFAGHITEIQLHPGAACAPYQPLVRLVDTSRCYFVGHIDGVAAARLKLDEPVKIQIADGKTVAGKICFISPVVDAASGLARIKAIFDNLNDAIRPGLAATLVVE